MSDTSTYNRGIIMSGAGMLILSPDGLLLRLVTEASTWDVIFYRSVFVAAAIGIFLLLKERKDYSSVFRNFGRAGWISTILMTLISLSFVGAIANTSVANTLVLVATMPFFSAILGWIFIGETVRPRTWISISLACGGILIIFSGSFGEGNWLGDSLAISTAFLQGLNLVVIRKAKERNVTVPALCVSAIFATLIALPFAQPMAITSGDLFYLALMGLAVVPIALVLFLSGARYAPAAEVALLALVETVLGPIWVWLGVGETPSQMALIGGSVVIISIASNAWLGMRSARRETLNLNG
jgi:drug/metabolite transporter (DMT)-like permease